MSYRSRALLIESNLVHNLERIRTMLPQACVIMPVLKANAYGHGDQLLAAKLQALGLTWAAVANTDEAWRVFNAGFHGAILCLGVWQPYELLHAPPHTRFTLHHFENLEALKQLSTDEIARLRFHVEIDTGMNRVGFSARDLPRLCQELVHYAAVIEGIFSHFAESETTQGSFSHDQFSQFQQVADALSALCGRRLFRHISNSGGMLQFPSYALDMVRPGIALYGYPPIKPDLGLRPILEWRAPVVQVRTLEKGDTVSYGRTFQAQGKMRVATLAVGYGDGYLRAYAPVGVTLHGQHCPTLGRICMDYMMVDVSHLKITPKLGDEAVLIHAAADVVPNADNLAGALRSIPYEVLTALSQRVARMWGSQDLTP